MQEAQGFNQASERMMQSWGKRQHHDKHTPLRQRLPDLDTIASLRRQIHHPRIPHDTALLPAGWNGAHPHQQTWPLLV
jgi:hypothetical protein